VVRGRLRETNRRAGETIIERDGKEGMATNRAIFAAGCFWGVEAEFRMMRGVVATQVGYTGGITPNPTYEEVCSHTTGHAEAVEVEFDPEVVSYDDLVERFWQLHDPTQVNRQGWDLGDQYRTAIFTKKDQAGAATASRERAQQRFRKPIATLIEPAGPFYRAEEYHQQYLEKRGQASCVIPTPATQTSSPATKEA
jgi:peptide-methionine (S)-S-oxide reductase